MKRLAGWLLVSVPVWAMLGLGYALAGWEGFWGMAAIGAALGVLVGCVGAGLTLLVEETPRIDP